MRKNEQGVPSERLQGWYSYSKVRKQVLSSFLLLILLHLYDPIVFCHKREGRKDEITIYTRMTSNSFYLLFPFLKSNDTCLCQWNQKFYIRRIFLIFFPLFFQWLFSLPQDLFALLDYLVQLVAPPFKLKRLVTFDFGLLGNEKVLSLSLCISWLHSLPPVSVVTSLTWAPSCATPPRSAVNSLTRAPLCAVPPRLFPLLTGLII